LKISTKIHLEAQKNMNNNAGGITTLEFELYYRAIAIKTRSTGTKTAMKTSGTE
jgi:hypothetical protein